MLYEILDSFKVLGNLIERIHRKNYMHSTANKQELLKLDAVSKSTWAASLQNTRGRQQAVGAHQADLGESDQASFTEELCWSTGVGDGGLGGVGVAAPLIFGQMTSFSYYMGYISGTLEMPESC